MATPWLRIAAVMYIVLTLSNDRQKCAYNIVESDRVVYFVIRCNTINIIRVMVYVYVHTMCIHTYNSVYGV